MLAIDKVQAAPFNVPGPQAAPILGRTGNLLQFARDPLGVLDTLFHTYGKVVAFVENGGTRLISPAPECPGTVFVYGPEFTRLAVTQPHLYHKSAIGGAERMDRRQQMLWRFGTGLFAVNGEEHREHRRLLMPAFHKKQIETYCDDMLAITERVLSRWRVGEQRNVQKDMTRLSLYIAGKTLFGEDESEVENKMGATLERMIRISLAPSSGFFAYDVPGLPYHRLLDLAERAYTQLQQTIDYKRKYGQDDTDVLAMLIRAQDEGGAYLSDDEIIGHAGIIFLAGHETTANALTWTLLLLSQHPRIAADLYDELNSTLHGQPPNLEQISQLSLLERVVKESLRLLTPVPLNHRIADEATTIGGYSIPAGTELLVSIYHTHTDPELFPNPKRFDPDRWLTINPSPFEYNPFSAGPRMCIGATFALLEMKVVLATLLQRFRPEFIPGTRLDRRVKITMSPLQGLPMIIRSQDRKFGRGVGGLRGNVAEMVEWPTSIESNT